MVGLVSLMVFTVLHLLRFVVEKWVGPLALALPWLDALRRLTGLSGGQFFPGSGQNPRDAGSRRENGHNPNSAGRGEPLHDLDHGAERETPNGGDGQAGGPVGNAEAKVQMVARAHGFLLHM